MSIYIPCLIQKYLLWSIKYIIWCQKKQGKSGVPKNVRHSISLHASNSTTPHPQHRKINCSFANALAKNPLKNLRGGLRCAKRGTPRLQLRIRTPQNQLQLAECTCRKRCTVGCEVLRGIPFRSAPPTPLPQRRKINCTLQSAVAEKAACGLRGEKRGWHLKVC